jgi:hypothetical protein
MKYRRIVCGEVRFVNIGVVFVSPLSKVAQEVAACGMIEAYLHR